MSDQTSQVNSGKGMAHLPPLHIESALVPLHESVLQHVRKAILQGLLQPGEVLSENKLAARLEVSRTPVREALRSLVSEGLVTVQPGRKIIVSVTTVQEIDDVYEIRGILEAEALRRITPEHKALIAGLRECTTRARAAQQRGDDREVQRANSEFHHTLTSVLNNQRLKQVQASLDDILTRFRLYLLQEPPIARRGIDEHEQLTQCLAAGDHQGALELHARHLRFTREFLRERFAEYSSAPVRVSSGP